MKAFLDVLIGGLVFAVLSLATDGVIASGTTAIESAPSPSFEPSRDAANSSTTSHALTIAQTPVQISNGTCPSRTVNYVTHTLAQQCLRSDWSRNRTGTLDNSTVSQAKDDSTHSNEAERERQIVSDATATATLATASSDEVQGSTATDAKTPFNDGDLADGESPLDTAQFLSFEEWKKQNLAKVGQSSEHLSARAPLEPGRKAPNLDALDSFGDENEIDLGFTGFGAASLSDTGELTYKEALPKPTEDDAAPKTSPALQALRPRDAGRTCKERTNYASFDCAATILKSNPECKSASSVLVENKDSYMLNKCSASNKFFIVELCNDILIDTIVLANYEFFSSIFRQFRVSVSDRYPVKAEKWKDLGTFEASNTREVQAFLVENPLIWARYVRIEFLTHYGSEYYCPVSLLRVHGTTMMEEFRNQEELSRGESDAEDEFAATAERSFQTETSITVINEPTNIKSLDSEPSKAGEMVNQTTLVEHATVSSIQPASSTDMTIRERQTDNTSPATGHLDGQPETCAASVVVTSSAVLDYERSSASTTTTSSVSDSVSSVQTSSETTAPSSRSTTGSLTASGNSVPAANTISASPVISNQSVNSTTATAADTTSPGSGSTRSVDGSMIAAKESSRSSVSSSIKTGSSPPAPPPAQPTTQESFFKSISKRLQQLESNSTLSLQYIEEQSRILRDAFSKVEKRQINTTASFLSNLNKTVMTELAGFRQAYDQLWQSTVIELEGQREQHKLEMTALSTRLTLVVDELVWQKRMGIVQSTLLLLCLALVLFGRNLSGTPDASLMQQVMLRSQSAFRSGVGSETNSPAGSRSPVSLFRRKLPLWGDGSRWKDMDGEQHSAVPSAEDSPTLHVESDGERELYDDHSDMDAESMLDEQDVRDTASI